VGGVVSVVVVSVGSGVVELELHAPHTINPATSTIPMNNALTLNIR
jgi:hypothetical protein